MRCKNILFCCLVLTLSSALIAQTDHAWIGTGKVRARITPTGIHRDTEGGFLLESSVPGQPAKNLLSHLTPWVGGIDPGNNLKLACEMDDPLISDWQAGFRDIPNSGKVWKVTIEQIGAHLKDYQDNGIIDNPIPEIFSWPGRGNPFSEAYNGFSMDSVNFWVDAPFHEDFDINGRYNPEKGDYPGEVFVGDTPFFPTEIVFAPFFDHGSGDLSNAKSTDFDARLLAFTVECQERDFLKNTIFFEMSGWLNRGLERLDSLHFGIYADFDIGDPDDDYLGCVEEFNKKIVYCYNSDTLNDNLVGAAPPTVAIMTFNSGNDIDGFQNLIPIFSSGFPTGVQMPSAPNEFYNYLTGTWREGSPITTGGIGYNPAMVSNPQNVVFPDHPTSSNGWSELSENNPLGNRRCVVSYGPTTLMPQYRAYPLRFALTASDKVGVTQQLKHLGEMRDLQRYIYNGCWDCPNPFDSLCSSPVSVKELTPITRIAPNPTYDVFTLQTPRIDFKNLILANALGQIVSIDPPQFIQENEVQISLKNLPAGMYFLQWLSKNGQRGCEKVVKN